MAAALAAPASGLLVASDTPTWGGPNRGRDGSTSTNLDPRLSGRFPHQLSGGQRQRACIARAIAVEPAFVIGEEIVSGLDVSTQAQALTLLRALRRDLGLALVFIGHDLSVVRALCDRVVVLRGGAAVEAGSAESLFAVPRHSYTRALLAAIPLPEPDATWLDRKDGAGARLGD